MTFDPAFDESAREAIRRAEPHGDAEVARILKAIRRAEGLIRLSEWSMRGLQHDRTGGSMDAEENTWNPTS